MLNASNFGSRTAVKPPSKVHPVLHAAESGVIHRTFSIGAQLFFLFRKGIKFLTNL